jgi:hypothetical protein
MPLKKGCSGNLPVKGQAAVATSGNESAIALLRNAR